MKSVSRAFGFFIVLAIWLVWQQWPAGKFVLSALDVGQGDALLIETQAHHQILVDGGPDDQVLVGLARRMPFWDRTIELVILSHNHADHLGGLIEVARRYHLKEVWVPPAAYRTPEFTAWQAALLENGTRVRVVSAGEAMKLDEVQLEVVYPIELHDATVVPESQHDATVVVKVNSPTVTALLTGDLEARHEEEMLARYCAEIEPCPSLQADVLKVPHHGSKTGLEPLFLAAIAPKVAIISVGARNAYGHPDTTVLDRLATAQVPVYRTDQQGEIRITFEDELIVEPEKN